MNDFGLSTQQLAVICALSSGATMSGAAEQAGVHRNTITNWRRNLLPFQHALAHTQYDRALFFREKIEEQVDLAIKTIHDILTDPKAPASVRLKAALAIIQTASTPPAPRKQVTLEVEKIVIERSQPENVTGQRLATVPPVHNDAQTATSPTPPSDPDPTIVPKSAQPDTSNISVNVRSFAAHCPQSAPNSAQPSRPEALRAGHPKIGRNDACPCGSGKKYKRCCLNIESGPLATAA